MFLYIKKSERIKTDCVSVAGRLTEMLFPKHTICFNTHIGNSVFNLSRWCNGSIAVSKTVCGGSSPSLDAKLFYVYLKFHTISVVFAGIASLM